eukprot:TRINITY_DN9573_c0_g1_i1.p2 TRINITY_DN9573_c0_g1~~TRINITY_DN9573_c0_g1_i1.p2  ORF type:complete len:280 (+),score=57.19 TRINITY_DN9573_c0_g1_i1:628-1467(+)
MTNSYLDTDELRDGGESERESSRRRVIFVILDIFDSFLEYIALFKSFLAAFPCANTSIVLFNYPGQSFTLYDEEAEVHNAESMAAIIDCFIFKFSFIGFGFGSYILAYLTALMEAFPAMHSVTFVNGYFAPDDKLKSVLNDYLARMDDTNDDKMLFQLGSFLFGIARGFGEERLEIMSKRNQIRREGRRYLVEAATNSVDLRPILPNMKVNVNLINSMANTFVNIEKTDVFLYPEEDTATNPRDRQQVYKVNRYFIEGNHDLLRENSPALIEALHRCLI